MCPMAMNIWFTSYRKHYMVLIKLQGPKTKRLIDSWKNRDCKKLNESQPILPKLRHENHNFFVLYIDDLLLTGDHTKKNS
jgi:hypothetical protein